MPAGGLGFDAPVPQGGYAWWYVDALSDDGTHGLTIIAFIGSVFSPYYAWARRRGGGDPQHHCALNVALYGRGAARWTMTERGRTRLSRDAATLAIGPSALGFDGTALTIDIDEIAVPFPSRVRGTIRLHPQAMTQRAFVLDEAGDHRWWPIAPSARIEVALQRPALRWSGHAYLDTNSGAVPLETSFRSWDWARGAHEDGATILYNTQNRGGRDVSLSLAIGRDGSIEERPVLPPAALPRTLWRLPRVTRADAGAHICKTFVDAPFYARSLIAAAWHGRPVEAVHESLSLDRFALPIVQAMLPFRMPRTTR